jgi:hypothetical protein
MTHIIEQQKLYLQTTKQRIVRNLNDKDEEIDVEVNNHVDMEGVVTTIRDFSMNHLDNKGNALFHSMEHTNTSGVYRPIDDSLDALGDWDNADAHFRYHSNAKLNIAGIQPRGEQSELWKKHLFVKTKIPTVIDTSHLHQPPKGRQNNRVQP